MDHKKVLANIPAAQRLRLQTRSNQVGLLHLAGHWGLILLVGFLIHMRLPFWYLLLPIQGVLIIFTFTILHECTHRTPFKSLWLNEAVGWICGAMVGLPFLWFRYFHMAHHKHTNDPANDPELVGHSKPQNWRSYVWYLSGLPIWLGQLKVIGANALRQGNSPYVPQNKRRTIQVESIIIVIFYILVAIYSFKVSTAPLILWILPVLLGQPALRFFLLAEHGRCPPVANMLENTRTTFTHRSLRFLAWNMPFHIEHHTAPNVPFYKLPELHAHMQAYLKCTEDGYRRFHTSYVKGFEQE